MASYATLQVIDGFDSREREGVVCNDRFISYYQIETVLRDYPKVLEAGAVVKIFHGDNSALKVLKVYLTLDETFFNEDEREEYCKDVQAFLRHCFGLRIPISVNIRERLPITKSGKVLRSVLLDY